MVENNSYTETIGEIDLIDIFNRIFKWFGKCIKAIGLAILKSVAFLYRNILVISLSILIGFAISYLLRQTEKPLYKSEITFRNNSINNADMISYFDQLGNIVSRKSSPEIASALLISDSEASDLVGLSTYWVIDINNDEIPDYVDYKNKHNPSDTVNVRMPDRFVVEIASLDPMNLSNIREGLINYAKNHPLAETSNNQRIKSLNELIDRLNIDIKELDSLQKVKYFEETRRKISEGGQIVLLQEQQTQLFYSDIQNLISKKQSYEDEIALYPDVVSVISDFSPSTTRVNTAFYYSKITVPLSLFLAIVLLLLFKNRKKIIEVLNKY